MSKHYFHKSLQVGKSGEAAFLKLFPHLVPTDGRSGDFIDEHGHKWEVKSDQYDHNRTQNFFIEVFSSIEKGTPGGPGQALLHGCKYFVYYFQKNNIAYVFDTQDLVEQLKNIDMGTPIEIRNIRWTTVGHKVPRRLLTPLKIVTTSKETV